MDWLLKLFLTVSLIIGASIHDVHGDAMVTGTVFCDQCKDGQISLYDYPLYGTTFLTFFFVRGLWFKFFLIGC